MIFLFLLAMAPQEKPETVTIPGEKVTFDLVAIPGGKIKDVTLRPFRMGAREVTWGEFNAYYEVPEKKRLDGYTRPSFGKTYFGQIGVRKEFLEDARPATNVRWHGAMGYCEWLSRKTGRYFRLPTETEWEYAARADGAQVPLDDVAWHKGNSNKITQPPGLKKPNGFGIYDMAGNVWEFCLEVEKPPVFVPILRGGSWDMPAAEVRIEARRTIPLEWFEADCVSPRSVWWLGSDKCVQGFRLVCVEGAAAPQERDAYAGKISLKMEIGEEVTVPTANTVDAFCPVKGEIRNGGDRTIDELEVMIHFQTPADKPHMIDIDIAKPGRATFTKCHPVLTSSVHGGETAKPLKAGETRRFECYIPSSFAPDGIEVDYKKVGGKVTQIRFAKE